MQFPLSYPLSLRFKIVALAPQLSVVDANGRQVAYIKQETFKATEEVGVFEDMEQTRLVFRVKPDRVVDSSVRFQFVDDRGRVAGAVKRRGARSVWRARYDVISGDSATMRIHEQNPALKAWDSLLGEIPVVGPLCGYVLHPVYLVTSAGDLLLMRMEKLPALSEVKFRIEKLAPLNVDDEMRAFLSLMMMVLLERAA